MQKPSTSAKVCEPILQEISENDDTFSEEEWSNDSEEDFEHLSSREKNLASPFNQPNIAFVFGTSKLYIQKDYLIDVSPVFKAMFSPTFLEGSLEDIPLPGKKISHFVHFLRYLSPGFEDELTEDTVHHMLHLADEYQTDDLKKKIEKFLTKGVLSESDSITSEQIISDIHEAERYKLNDYLTACIDVASRKKFQSLKRNSKFEEISQNTHLKIAFKRMDNIDKIYNNAVQGDLGLTRLKTNQFHMRDLGTNLKPYMKDN